MLSPSLDASAAPLPTRREDLLARLAEPQVWDLVVVGGGATGLGVALQAAREGLGDTDLDRGRRAVAALEQGGGNGTGGHHGQCLTTVHRSLHRVSLV